MSESKHVLVTPVEDARLHPLTSRLFTDGQVMYPFSTWPGQHTPTSIMLHYGEFKPRYAMENDPAFLQLITYVLCQKEGKLLSYKRQGTEGRLHGLSSVGIGGHIDKAGQITVIKKDGYLMAEAERELREEGVITDKKVEIIGLIYSHKSDEMVQRVHVGVVMAIDLNGPGDKVVASEECGEFTWVDWDEVTPDKYEEWSVAAVDLYNRRMVTRQSMTTTQKQLLACRPKGDKGDFYAPHRDIAHVGLAMVSDIPRLTNESRWDYLLDAIEPLAGQMSHNQGLMPQVDAALEAVVRMLSMTSDLGDSPEFGEAMLKSRLHETPIAGRIAVFSMLGLSCLAATWVGLRQEYSIGNEPEQSFERLWPVASAVLRQYMGSHTTDDLVKIFEKAARDLLDAGYTGAQAEHILAKVASGQ